MPLFLTLSQGISSAKELPDLLGASVKHINYFQSHFRNMVATDSVMLGWGLKNNTYKPMALARKLGIPYWGLEDGFISYLGHPALGDKRFSLIVDTAGIYYDATKPSDIENLLNQPDWMTPELQQRSATFTGNHL